MGASESNDTTIRFRVVDEVPDAVRDALSELAAARAQAEIADVAEVEGFGMMPAGGGALDLAGGGVPGTEMGFCVSYRFNKKTGTTSCWIDWP